MTSRSMTRTLRQHHAIEHATVSLLSRRLTEGRLFAHSDLEGFIVLGEVETAVLRTAAGEALARLQGGETELAIHPNCGTNLVTAGALAGLAALLMSSGRNRSWWWDRLPSAILGAILALLLAGPAGHWLQANVTTSADVADLRIISVTKLSDLPLVRHRVTISVRAPERPVQ